MAVLKSPMNDTDNTLCNEKNFGGFMLDHLRRHSNSKWINGTSHQEKTYGDVAEEAVNVHCALGSLGFGAGDKILVLATNRAELLPLFVGAACANVAFVYEYPGYAAELLIEKMQDLQLHVDAIFCEYGDVKEILKLPSSLPTVKHIVVFCETVKKTKGSIGSAFTWTEFLCMGETAQSLVVPCVHYIGRHFCYMSSTSGTTGKPKMVVHYHESLVAGVQANSHPRHMGLKDKDVLLSTATVGHVYALFDCICKAIVQGVSAVFLETAGPDRVLEALQTHKVSVLATVPFVAQCLLDHPQRAHYDLSNLHCLITGGNYINDDVATKIQAELKLKSFAQLYGQTEFVFITGSILDAPTRHGSIGRLAMGVEAMVIDNKTGERLGPGQHGELVVRGPGIMRGYWGRLDEPVTDANGWYKTGDECYYDEEEWLYLVERLSEFIHCRHIKLAPARFEAVLMKCPQVQDCAVVGIPNPEAGQLPHAVVVPKPGYKDLSPLHFQRFIEENAPKAFRLEGGVTIVNEIPRNKLGKLVRRELLKWILDRRAKGGGN